MKKIAFSAVACAVMAHAAAADTAKIAANFGDWYEAEVEWDDVSLKVCDEFDLGAYVAIPVTGCSKTLAASDVIVAAGTFSAFGTPQVKTDQEMWDVYCKPLADLKRQYPQAVVVNLDKNWSNDNWQDVHGGKEYELARTIWGSGADPDTWTWNEGRQWILVPTHKVAEWKGWKYFFVGLENSDDYAQINLAVEDFPGPKPSLKPMPSGGGSAPASTIPTAWQKARTLTGVATMALPSPYDLRGIFEIKCGKANKHGIASVSAKLTRMNGKKVSYRAQKVDVTGGAVEVVFDGMTVTIGDETFFGGSGLPGGMSVGSAVVGGALSNNDAKVEVDAADFSMFAGTVQGDFFPAGVNAELVLPAPGGKWKFAKAAGVKFAKPKGASEKILMKDVSKGKTNLSGMKLAYTPKTGVFKGSFKVYALEGEGAKTKLKKYTLKVNGFVVDGVGYGEATLKKPEVSWPVSVK